MKDKKECTICGEVKSLEGFHRNHRMSDGHVNQCKTCRTPMNAAWNRANRERMRSVNTRWRKRNPDKKRESDKRWRKKNPAAVRRWNKKAEKKGRELYPEKFKARKAVDNALRRGAISKPDSCSECGEAGQIHGHHEDYSRPLDVTWLCVGCHVRRHRGGDG